jgi:hypothetical protein
VRTAIVVVIIALLLVFVYLVYLHYRSRPDAARIPSEPANIPAANARAGPEYAYPNLDLTPGAIDPAVTQDNIQSTICVSGYTKTVRPSSTITHRLKLQIMMAYGINGDPSEYELDHFIPLELGGCGDCVANLWPERYDLEFGAKEKDRVENFLHRRVCSGGLTLEQGQNAMRDDWVKVYEQMDPPPP